MADNKLRVAIAWYTEKEWRKVKKIAADKEIFDNSYDEWLEGAEKAYVTAIFRGTSVEKVNLSAEEINKYCRQNKVANTSRIRSGIAASKLREIDERAD